jgi:hypothetical protein
MKEEAELMFTRIINLARKKFEEESHSSDTQMLAMEVTQAFTDAAEQLDEEHEKIASLEDDYTIVPKWSVSARLREARTERIVQFAKPDPDLPA